jgi:prepilin-type N-terminal cleavage/methylation domain-containing protein
MIRTAPPRRAGFTLLELLVVITILSLLSVIVLPSLSGSVNSRRYRDAAKNVSAFIARCQSRAIGARAPRGVMLQPLSGNTASAIDLHFADTPDPYAGETIDSAVTFNALAGTAMTVNFVIPCSTCNGTGLVGGSACGTCNGQLVGADTNTQARLAIAKLCTVGDAIQFGGSGPKFKFVPPNGVTMWFEDNQNTRNTAWPQQSATGGVPFRIWRQPTRGTGGGLQIGKGVCVDLARSTMGPAPFYTIPGETGPGKIGFIIDQTQPISIMFDSTGKPSEIVHSGGLRTSVSAPIFLLVGEGDLAGNPYDPSVSGDTGTAPDDRGGANWQYGDCVWLCIDNNSGVVKSGQVRGRQRSVLDSQRFVRLTIGYGTGEK